MSTPATTTRGTPSGNMLKNGYQAKLAFSLNPTLSIWEKAPKLPGVDGGEAVDNTHQLLTAWRIMRARTLKTLTPFTIKAAFSMKGLDTTGAASELLDLTNREGAITSMAPDGSTFDYFGFLQKTEFDDFVDGTQPTANLTIVPTNWDPVAHVEAGPVLTLGTGS